MFELADADKDGFVDFGEFATTMSVVIRGELPEKLRFLFDVLDLDGSGEVEVSELAAVVRHSGREMQHLLDYAEEVMKAFDLDGSGECVCPARASCVSRASPDATRRVVARRIDAEEFVSSITRDPALMDSFYVRAPRRRPRAAARRAVWRGLTPWCFRAAQQDAIRVNRDAARALHAARRLDVAADTLTFEHVCEVRARRRRRAAAVL